ncbi:hypothetical protein RC1_0216 [Rhodospirillum centenum SW]|uniref:Uncharacterized protein n=1 Tax=Rhodospirillum centenum (strain ATCC 51521 / SW) TaxID=414684 RepID=B6IQC9_RHOCS|nr:hypothetical protein RC1_0216 [Rhodospirillum centenum SW]
MARLPFRDRGRGRGDGRRCRLRPHGLPPGASGRRADRCRLSGCTSGRGGRDTPGCDRAGCRLPIRHRHRTHRQDQIAPPPLQLHPGPAGHADDQRLGTGHRQGENAPERPCRKAPDVHRSRHRQGRRTGVLDQRAARRCQSGQHQFRGAGPQPQLGGDRRVRLGAAGNEESHEGGSGERRFHRQLLGNLNARLT